MKTLANFQVGDTVRFLPGTPFHEAGVRTGVVRAGPAKVRKPPGLLALSVCMRDSEEDCKLRPGDLVLTFTSDVVVIREAAAGEIGD